MGKATDHDLMLRDLLAVGAELSTATMLYHQAAAARLNLNVTDLGCLQVVISAGQVTAGELAQRAMLSPGAVTGVIDRLEAAELVRRVRDPRDRRRVIVEPIRDEIEQRVTPLGVSIHAAVAAKVRRYTVTELRLVLEYLTDSLDTLRAETHRLQDSE